MQGGPKNNPHNAIHITSSNILVDFKFFHHYNLHKICSAAVIKYPATPRMRRYVHYLVKYLSQKTSVSCALWQSY